MSFIPNPLVLNTLRTTEWAISSFKSMSLGLSNTSSASQKAKHL